MHGPPFTDGKVQFLDGVGNQGFLTITFLFFDNQLSFQKLSEEVKNERPRQDLNLRPLAFFFYGYKPIILEG